MPLLVKSLTPDIAAYIAGLIDGEGTVTLTRSHANERRRLVVSIANTELDILRFVHSAVGVGKITRKRITSERHTPSFCYAISSAQALELLRQIEPWLRSTKGTVPDWPWSPIVLSHRATANRSKDTTEARTRFEIAFLAIRAEPDLYPAQVVRRVLAVRDAASANALQV